MISIILFTHDRLEYALRTLESVAEHLSTSDPLRLHIADDGSPENQRQELLDIAKDYFGNHNVTIHNSNRRGYGANYNLATQYVHSHSDIILPLEDDWELVRSLNLDPLVDALKDPRIDCIRMGYLGTTQSLRGEVIHVSGQTFLLLDPDSPEPHVFAGHPRLETREFERRLGSWPEGIAAGPTEFEVSKRPAARARVVWPLDLLKAWGDLWAHIGTIPSESAEVRGDAPAVSA